MSKYNELIVLVMVLCSLICFSIFCLISIGNQKEVVVPCYDSYHNEIVGVDCIDIENTQWKELLNTSLFLSVIVFMLIIITWFLMDR